MISGTNCDWTADGALDCGIIMAGLVLSEPSFNLDTRGLWINLRTRPTFFPLFARWHIHTHTHVSFDTCFERSKLSEVVRDRHISAPLLVLLKCEQCDFDKIQREFLFLIPPLPTLSDTDHYHGATLNLHQEMMSLDCLTSLPFV